MRDGRVATWNGVRKGKWPRKIETKCGVILGEEERRKKRYIFRIIYIYIDDD